MQQAGLPADLCSYQGKLLSQEGTPLGPALWLKTCEHFVTVDPTVETSTAKFPTEQHAKTASPELRHREGSAEVFS